MRNKQIDMERLEALWGSTMRSDAICDVLGITRDHLFHLARKHRLGLRPANIETHCERRAEDPTEEEIKERAAAIRSHWSPFELRQRMVGGRYDNVEIRHFWFDKERYVFSP